MKKFLYLLIFTLSLSIFTLAGCVNNNNYESKLYCSEENIINNIVIDVTNREIEINNSTDNKVYASFYENEKEIVDINVNNNDLVIKLSHNNSFNVISSTPPKEYRKLVINVPNNQINNVSISTTNNNVSINNFSVLNNVSIINIGGNINFDNIYIGNQLNLKNKNGNISGNIIGSWDEHVINCKIKKGKCNLPLEKLDGTKFLNAECNNGDININFVNN